MNTIRATIPEIVYFRSADKGSGQQLGMGTGKQHTGRRILYIEDNEELQMLVNFYLKPYYTVDQANRGEKAVQLARNNRYDAIITDINLGSGMDGVETIDMIRQDEWHSNVPVAAATAYSGRDVKQSCRQVGMQAFIVKPFMKEDLLRILDNIIKESEALVY